MFFPSKNPRIEVTVILLAYYIYFWLSTLARTREVSSAIGPSVSIYPTDTHISSGWSLLTDYVAEFDRPCFPANRHASREYSSSDLLSGARALLTSLSSLSASASAWLTTSRCERTLGDAPNAGDFVRRKITFLGRRTRKPFLSLSLSLSLSFSSAFPLSLVSSAREGRLDLFERYEKFQDTRSVAKEVLKHRSVKRVIRSLVTSASYHWGLINVHSRKVTSVYFVSAVYVFLAGIERVHVLTVQFAI